ncbi:MAG: hypothetical protein ABSF88_11225 [Candidatus Aminicenantales bacterium]|jgi:hypothetical protein
MKVVAFITDYAAVDRIIDHLKLTFVAEKPLPSHVFEQVVLMAEGGRSIFEVSDFMRGRGLASFGRFSGRPRR